MLKLTVLYDRPGDVAAFESHYFGTHLPLARNVPGIERVEVTVFSPGPDGAPPRHHLMAELYFPDAETMRSALGSAEGTELGADVAHFADVGSTHLLGEVR